MKFFMEKNKDIGHRVTIHIPKTIVNDAIFRELIKISKKTNINGFRKGKIPIKIVQKKYGETIYYDVFKELMQKFFYEFLQKEKIKIIGFPKYYINSNIDKKKELFEYYVDYDLYPEFEIKDLHFIEATKISVKIKDEDIQKKIKEQKEKNNAIWNTINKPIKSDDRVTINYSIYQNNKKIEKFHKENIIFIVSNNQFLTDLNNKIINHLTNDIIFFKIKCDEYHPEKELQKKEIIFKIKIIKIERKELLELNEIKETNQIETVSNQKKYENTKYNIKYLINKISQKKLKEQILEEITKKYPISIPMNLFKEEINFLYQKKQKKYKNNDNLLEKKYYFNLNLQAKKRVCHSIILEKVISKNNFFKNEEKLQALIKKISLDYTKNMKIINLYNKNENFKNIIKSIALKKQAMFWLIENVKIKIKTWTFDEFIKYTKNNHEALFI